MVEYTPKAYSKIGGPSFWSLGWGVLMSLCLFECCEVGKSFVYRQDPVDSVA